MNVLMFGPANRNHYTKALLGLDPEGLKVVGRDCSVQTLKEVAKELEVPVTISKDGEIADLDINHIFYFSSYIGMDAVIMLEDAIENKTTITFINPT